MNRVLVTGANRGIGLELCRQLSARGDEPVAVCRQGIPVEQAASGLIARMDELELGSTGTFWHAEGERLPW